MVEQVNFGYKKVDYNQKETLVGEVFSSVASKYDLMNDLMSLGIHRLWKRKFVSLLQKDKKLLDVASGTADIAKLYYKKCTKPDITLSDINQDMLNLGRENLLNQNIYKGLNFVCANAEDLPFNDCEFDYYTISFGIRNVTNIAKVLKEAHRVLKPGGRFLCMEFAKVDNPCLHSVYDLYLDKIIPNIGEYVAKDKASYKYLAESIKLFPKQEIFIKMVEDAGFSICSYENLSFGIVAIYSGFKV
jgi:ubiquinone/menaquinone biosynthesis methyltransferase